MREGHYAFSNDTHINAAGKAKNNKQLVRHEFVHKKTVAASTYGTLLIMMEKASLIDNSKIWLFNELLDIYNKMQEQTATFIEYFGIIQEEGIEEFYRKVEELKNTNKVYYKHFSFIFDYIKKEDFSDEELVKNIINLITAISIISSNIKLDKLPFDEWSEKKDIQRFFSKNENVLKFNPNKRFETLIKGNFAESSKYENQVKIISENTYLEKDLINIGINAINQIYCDSKGLNIIRERVSTFQLQSYDFEDINLLAELTAFPLLYNTDWKITEEMTELDVTLNKLKEDNNTILYFHHLLAGLEKTSILSCFSVRDSELKVTSSKYYLEEITSIIKKVDNPIVFAQSKIYTRYKDVLHQKLSDRHMYIFMENSLYSSYQFISSEFSSSKYMQISQEGYDIIVIRKQNFTLLQLVVKGLGKEVKDALAEINIQPANILETMAIYSDEEIKKVASVMLNAGSAAAKNKKHGFK
ncbi:hypothetical protein [Bacillus paranthracis]|uniref:hypothetical protein n=1 Tax=Bacillus paranthracis TaxID=2026186 RepID=UPI000B43E6F9|nr:hypothetical protein [Bacillus thuringiensis]MBH0345675.1 hypothetical protein [Bacillus thuringiensis]OTY11280.1 hypothetical protein BK731_00485 [Bacillus thuringiensis serovar muju]